MHASYRTLILSRKPQADQLKLIELERASIALQHVVDAASSVSEPENILPAVLRITTQIFDAQHCLLFSGCDRWQLTHWFKDGGLLSWKKIAGFAVGGQSTADILRNGFPAFEECFGGINFRNGIAFESQQRNCRRFPNFHATLVSLGVELELIVPLQANGILKGAMLLAKAKTSSSTFTPHDLALAGLVASQITLAVETGRLSKGTYQRPVQAPALTDSSTAGDLSDRQREVLKQIVYGRSNKQIASQLRIALGTVKIHVAHIFKKLDVRSRAEAVAIAFKRGLVEQVD